MTNKEMIEGLKEIASYCEYQETLDNLFTSVKSIISDCICKTAVCVGKKTDDLLTLNQLANEYTNKILAEIKEEKI